MTKNEIYTIEGLLIQAKAKTLNFIAKLVDDLKTDREDEESIKESIDIQKRVYDHYDGCLKSLRKMVEKEGE